jgi:YHS domain-containing protein
VQDLKLLQRWLKHKFDQNPEQYADTSSLARSSRCAHAHPRIRRETDINHDHKTATEVLDPICGMSMALEDSTGTVEYKGATYYFCNLSCEEKLRSIRRNTGARTGRLLASLYREFAAPSRPEHPSRHCHWRSHESSSGGAVLLDRGPRRAYGQDVRRHE